jgi:hypothetical protein
MGSEATLGRCRRIFLRPLAALALLAAGGAFGLRAEAPGPLLGQELQPAGGDMQSIVSGILSEGHGTITHVTVTDDRDARLALRVAYDKLGGRQIVGELRGAGGQPVPGISRAKGSLVDESGEVELAFQPGATLPPGAVLEASAVRIKVLRKDVPLAELERTFVLRKKFVVPVPPDKVVVRVTARPEGAAAQLHEPSTSLFLPPVMTLPKLPWVAVPPPAQTKSGTPPGSGGKSQDSKPMTRSFRIPSQAIGGTTTNGTSSGGTKTNFNLPVSASAMMKLKDFDFGLGSSVTDKNGKGPGTVVFDLLEGLRADAPITRDAITRVSTQIVQDQNPASGIFYFLPQAYAVAWTPDEGYGLRMLYGAAGAEGAAGEVTMAARLQAGVDVAEVQLAKDLLTEYHKRHTSVAVSELLPLPIDKAPELSLAGDLQHRYQIPPERVAVTALADALGQVEVSWATDTVTKENIQLALVEAVGINGTLTLTPAGGGLASQTVPVRIQLADAATFGRVSWQRGHSWQNRTPYPARLSYLHVLVLESGGPVVYSWNLDGATVPPLAKAEVNASAVPAWLDARARRMWIEYAPVEDCDDCDQKVIAEVTGGVTSMGAAQIIFHTMTPIADLGAYEIALTVRSRYFDPQSRTVQTKAPVVINADNHDYTLGPVFLVNRQPGDVIPGDPLFEYRLDVTMPDGSTHPAQRWLTADNLRVLIGRAQLQQALGMLPGGS